MNTTGQRAPHELLVKLVIMLAIATLVLLLTASRTVAQTAAQTAPSTLTRADCMGCHPRVHDLVLGHTKAASAKCADCHAGAHENYDKIESLYAGTMRGALHPDVMFKARVACAECHVDTTLAPRGVARVAALDHMCTTCHGARFAGMLTRWSAGMQWRIESVVKYSNRVARDPRSSDAARSRAQTARAIASLIASAGPSHNLQASDALLRSALASVAAAYSVAPPSLGPDPQGTSCVRCHYGVEASRDTAFRETFDHASHIVRANVACSQCHTSADFFASGKDPSDSSKRRLDPRHGKSTLTAASCMNCHHSTSAALSCAACHNAEPTARGISVTLPLRLLSKNAPSSRAVTFEHRDHQNAECESCHTSRETPRAVVACTSCHDKHHAETTAKCASCHGTEMLAEHTIEDHFACASCHARQTAAALLPNRAFCVSCHAKEADHKPDRECSPCHMQATPAALRTRIAGDP